MRYYVFVRTYFLVFSLALGCGPRGTSFDDAGSDAGVEDTGGNLDGFTQGDTGIDGGGAIAVIYAHTDEILYVMNPMSMAVTQVGPFSDGTSTSLVITDLAVNQSGDVWVNDINTIYKAQVPMPTGTVKLTKVVDIAVKQNQRFYALGFTPPNVLGTDEMLVAGDSLGDLYAIAPNGMTTQLGSFGPGPNGSVYGLSGDVMFYLQNGKTRGLATVRPYLNGTATVTNNDILAEIDVAAMQTAFMTKTPGLLKKQFLGTGTLQGRLYGIGAWNDSVYAFQRLGSNNFPAELVQINAQGTAKVIQMFPNITVGWSGAGVTTNAPVTVLPPN